MSVAPLANLSCPLEDLSSSWTPQMSACQSHIISTPQTARINEITAVFNLGLLFKIVGFALLLHCSSVNSIQITHNHSHVDEIMLPTLQLSDGLLNLLKKPKM